MCLILFAYQVHPGYKLIFAANRDEFYRRPTATAHWWQEHEHVLGGKDMKAGGSWLGISKTGKIAALTNFREPDNIKQGAPSRGDIIRDFLTEEWSTSNYTQRLEEKGKTYNGFNLIYGHIDQLHYFSNRTSGSQKITPGIYGLSNHLLDTPWPKVVKGKEKLSEYIRSANPSTEEAINWLYDTALAPDVELPATGVPREWERILSAMFILSPKYGTRSSTAILVDLNDRVTFHERSYIPENQARFNFELDRKYEEPKR